MLLDLLVYLFSLRNYWHLFSSLIIPWNPSSLCFQWVAVERYFILMEALQSAALSWVDHFYTVFWDSLGLLILYTPAKSFPFLCYMSYAVGGPLFFFFISITYYVQMGEKHEVVNYSAILLYFRKFIHHWSKMANRVTVHLHLPSQSLTRAALPVARWPHHPLLPSCGTSLVQAIPSPKGTTWVHELQPEANTWEEHIQKA